MENFLLYGRETIFGIPKNLEDSFDKWKIYDSEYIGINTTIIIPLFNFTSEILSQYFKMAMANSHIMRLITPFGEITIQSLYRTNVFEQYFVEYLKTVFNICISKIQLKIFELFKRCFDSLSN